MEVYIPKSRAKFQNLVDIAEGALALDAARLHGLVEGGPGVDVEKCSQLLKEGEKRGIVPRKDAIERFVLETMREQVIRRTNGKFRKWLDLLNRFVDREGHAFVPFRHVEDSERLGVWVTNRRADYRNRQLDAWKVAALEEVPGWSWGGNNKFGSFHLRFNLLKEYHQKHGNLRMPQTYRVQGILLGKWLAVMRSRSRKGELSLEKAEMLAQFEGWDQQYKKNRKVPFARWIYLLKKYIHREGHACVPGRHMEEEEPLGMWVKAQRANRKSGNLSSSRILELEKIPEWRWDNKQQFGRFLGNLAKLKEYARIHGHSLVPPKYVANGVQLGKWVVSVRYQKRKGMLHPEKIQWLEQVLGWDWNPGRKQNHPKVSEDKKRQGPVRVISFEQGVKLFQQFFHREGHGYPTRNHNENGFKLGIWVKEQRSAYHANNLSFERMQFLRQLAGWQWADHKGIGKFYQNREVLKAFISNHGHSLVPGTYKTPKLDLGNWVGRLRRLKRQKKLDSELMDILESTPGWTWESKRRMSGENAKKWNAPFLAWLQLLKHFIQREGHGYVPCRHKENGKGLGRWVHEMRAQHQNHTLPSWKADLLNTIPQWRWTAARQKAEGLKPRRKNRIYEAQFPVYITLLREFIDENGHARVPFRYIADGKKLGIWVSNRRIEYREGVLDAWKINQLEALPGWQWTGRR